MISFLHIGADPSADSANVIQASEYPHCIHLFEELTTQDQISKFSQFTGLQELCPFSITSMFMGICPLTGANVASLGKRKLTLPSPAAIVKSSSATTMNWANNPGLCILYILEENVP